MISPELLLGALGLLATGWGISRSGAVAGWKSVAEARKERIAEIEGAHARAEEREAVLARRVAELEALPDVAQVIERAEARHGETIGCLREIKEVLDGFADRWG